MWGGVGGVCEVGVSDADADDSYYVSPLVARTGIMP